MTALYVLPMVFENELYRIPVFPVLLRCGEELTLVDPGYSGFLPQIDRELNAVGFSPEQLTKAVVTHHDHDHMGALRELTDRYPGVEVWSSPEQAPYIAGKKKSLRLEQAERIQETLPDGEKEAGLDFLRVVASVKPVGPVRELTVGRELPWCADVTVVDTKGHMPGHISLYVAGEKTLVSGDALVVEDGRLCVAMPQFALDMPAARESVRRLLAYDIERIVCFHGGVYETNVRRALQEIVDRFDRGGAAANG